MMAEYVDLPKDQFAGNANEDVASHLHIFVELCDMQKKKCG